MVQRPQNARTTTKCRSISNKWGATTPTTTFKTVNVVVASPAATALLPSVVQVNCTKTTATPKEVGKLTVLNNTVQVNINVNTMAIHKKNTTMNTTTTTLTTNKTIKPWEQVQNKQQMIQKVDAPTTTTKTSRMTKVVANGTTVSMKNGTCFFSLATTNYKKPLCGALCGKKRNCRMLSKRIKKTPKNLVRAIEDHHQCKTMAAEQEDEQEDEQDEHFSKGECKSDDEMSDCKSETDVYAHAHEPLGGAHHQHLSRSSSVSDFEEIHEIEDADDGDEEQDIRIRHLENAIARTAQRCAMLEKKIEATNHANNFLRRSTLAAARRV